MQIENKNTTVLPPTSGFLKTDGGVSRESQLFLERHLPHQQEHHISFIQYFCNVSRSSLSVVHRLHGVIGLALLPLQFIVLLLMMILKLLVLNPPLCSSLQSTIRFELPSPARVAPSMNFRQGVETIYSFNYQTANRPNVKSRFVASPTSSIWWEDAVLGNFVRLPLFALPYGYLQDSDDISMIQLPLWALHPFTGVVFLKEQPGTRQVVVTE